MSDESNHEGHEEQEALQIAECAASIRVLGLEVFEKLTGIGVASGRREHGGIDELLNFTLVSLEPDGWSLWDGQFLLSKATTIDEVVALIRERYNL